MGKPVGSLETVELAARPATPGTGRGLIYYRAGKWWVISAANGSEVEVVLGSDGRLTDARTPLGHTHVATTDLTATGTKNATTFLRGDNTWATPTATPAEDLDGWPKKRVKVAETSFVPLPLAGLANVDGTAVVAGDRVLVTASGIRNGIWIAAAGNWTRATDADTSAKLAGAVVSVQRGTNNAGQWATSFKDTDVLDTSSMPWSKVIVPAMTQQEAEFTTHLEPRLVSGSTLQQSIAAHGLTKKTAQTLDAAAVKTFPPGTLLMQNAAATLTAEPYSDVNPPFTLNLSDQATEPTAPPVGQSTLYSPDGLSLRMKDAQGTDALIGPSAGGGGASGPELAATTDYSTTTPAVPTGGLKLFTRFRARRLPAFMGPIGQDTSVQPALFANRVGILAAQSGVTNLTPLGLPSPTVYTTTAASVLIAPGSGFYTSRARLRYPSAATANAFAGFRLPGTSWFLSTVLNNGGFFWVFRFGINAGTPTGRGFVGMSAANANEANADPTTLTNRIGFGYNSASANWYFHSAGSAANAATTDLGASFPARTYATHFYEFRLFAPAGAAQVYWSAHRLNDDIVVTGGPVTTNLPAVNILLTHHSWMNNVTAVAVSLDFQSLYIESDN